MKRLLILLLLGVAPAWGQVGTLATGTSNTNRPVIVPMHFSTSQPKPGGLAVTASGCVRSSNSVTCTLTGSPPSPGFAVGGNVVVASMTDSSFNGTFTLTGVSGTNLTWSQTAGDATTDSGTISSAMWPYPAQSGTYVDPQFGTTVERFYSYTSDPTPTDGSWTPYSNFPSENLTQEYAIMEDQSAGMFIIKRSDKSRICTGTVSGADFGGRWSPLAATPYKLYYVGSNKLKRITDVSAGCTTADVKTFSSYTSITISPSGAGGRVVKTTGGDETVVLYGTSSGTHSIFVYNITTDTVVTTTPPTTTSTIDEIFHWPDGTFGVMFTSNGSGAGQGIKYYNADGTLNRHVWDYNIHMDAGVDPDGANILVGWYNSDISAPCSNRGLAVWEVATGNTRCIFSLETAAAGGGYRNIGNHVSVSGYWAGFALDDFPLEVAEASLGSSWNTVWGRGTDEFWVCRTKGTIDGTNNCYRTAHVRSRNAGLYRRSPKCNLSMLLSTDAASAVPPAAYCNSDFGTAPNTGCGSANCSDISDPLRITLRSSGAPTLTSVTPNNGTQGTSPSVVLAGTGFDGGNAAVSVSGTGVTPTTCVVDSAIQISCTSFVIDAAASPTARNVSVTTDLGTSNTQTFTVNASGSSPTLTSLSPTSCWRGAQCTVVFTGTDLNGGSEVLNSSCGDATFPSHVVNGATTITAQVLIAAGSGGLSCNFSVTTAAGTSGNQTFTIKAPTYQTQPVVPFL